MRLTGQKRMTAMENNGQEEMLVVEAVSDKPCPQRKVQA